MTKKELWEKTKAAADETALALGTVYNALNAGQRKKLLKEESVAALLLRYRIVEGGDE